MIRVNLLEGARPRAETTIKPGEPVSLRVFQAKVFGMALAAFIVIAGLFYGYWNRQINQLHIKLRAEQAEAARLAGIQAENVRYARELSEMQQRIRTIQALESSRKGPVELMTSIGALVNRTPGLYLLSVDNKETQLHIQGQSLNVDAIADFIAALRTSGQFQAVTLDEYFQNDDKQEVRFKFTLDCFYQPAAPTGAAASAGGTAQAAKPAAATTPAVQRRPTRG